MNELREEYAIYYDDVAGIGGASPCGFGEWMSEIKVPALCSQLAEATARAEKAEDERDRLREAVNLILDERNITGAEEYVIVSLTEEDWRKVRDSSLTAPDKRESPFDPGAETGGTD